MAKTNKHEAMSAARQRSERIYETLRARICTNRYPPETLLREEDLAKEFEVSRTPIRRVLSMLEHDEFVTVRHGVGNIVTKVEPERLAEVYSVRMILAQAAGECFSTPFTAQAVEQMHRGHADFLALTPGDVVGFGEANIRYYMNLTGQVENACLRKLQRQLFFQTSRMWLISIPALDWAETLAAVAHEIEELIRVMELQDPVGLALVMRNHIFMSRRRVLAGLGLGLGLGLDSEAQPAN